MKMSREMKGNVGKNDPIHATIAKDQTPWSFDTSYMILSSLPIIDISYICNVNPTRNPRLQSVINSINLT
jgi:hypothetical protein